MVKKKIQSKRQTSRQRNKIFKKVTEHKRKMRKVARKKGLAPKALKKDPGVPNLWPFKEQLLEKIQAKKELDKEASEKQKTEKKKRKKDRADAMEEEKEFVQQLSGGISPHQQTLVSKQSQMAKLMFEAQQKNAEYNVKEDILNFQNSDDGTRDVKNKALSQQSKSSYYREFNKVVEKADVIIEVLDARDPLGCRCINIEKAIISKDANKKIILLLNKIDLVPREVVEKWIRYLKKDFPTIGFKSSTQKQRNHLGGLNNVIGAQNLLQLLKNYSRSENMKKNLTVGIVGYPNVGKSSVINSMKRSKVAETGAKPGMTRQSQEIQLDSHITLLDAPGIIFDSSDDEVEAALILRNAIRIEQLDDTISPVQLILNRCNNDRLMTKYDVPPFNSAEQFLSHIAKKRGMLGKGGKPRITAAGKIVLRDWNRGKISFFTLPPSDTNHMSGLLDDDDIDHASDLKKIKSLSESIASDIIPMMSSMTMQSGVTDSTIVDANTNAINEDDEEYDYAKDLEDSDVEIEEDDDIDSDDDI